MFSDFYESSPFWTYSERAPFSYRDSCPVVALSLKQSCDKRVKDRKQCCGGRISFNRCLKLKRTALCKFSCPRKKISKNCRKLCLKEDDCKSRHCILETKSHRPEPSVQEMESCSNKIQAIAYTDLVKKKKCQTYFLSSSEKC